MDDEMKIITSDDSNVDPPVDMDLLVDEQPDTEQEYRDGENKEPETQDPDPDKVVEADLAMDPAAATESFLHRMMYMTDEDLERGTEDFEKINELDDIGVNFQTRSIESIKVVDKHFNKVGYNSFEDFSIDEAGEYARESLNDKFSQILRPVSMKDYQLNKNTFNDLLFNKTVKEFKNKYLNPNVASKCSYTINTPDIYGTTSINVRFQSKDGKNSPIGAIYALEWYKGQPAVSPIVPIMKIDQSIEKMTGYFKRKDYKDWADEGKLPKNVDDFFNLKEVKDKIKLLKNEVKNKEMTFATMDECRNLKSTLFNKYLRGTAPDGDKDVYSLNIKYTKKFDIVWAYWIWKKNVLSKKSLSICAMTKTKKGKLTSVLFASVPVVKKFDSLSIQDRDKGSESYYFDPMYNL